MHVLYTCNRVMVKLIVNQWLLDLFLQFSKAPEGSTRKFESQQHLAEAMTHRTHIDHNIKLIGKLLFGIERGPEVLNNVRPAGEPLVDDWNCLKLLVRYHNFVSNFLQIFLLVLPIFNYYVTLSS